MKNNFLLIISIFCLNITLCPCLFSTTNSAIQSSKKHHLVTTEDWKKCTDTQEKICPRKKYNGAMGQAECVKRNLSKIPKLCQEMFKTGAIEVQKHKQEVAKVKKDKGIGDESSEGTTTKETKDETPQLQQNNATSQETKPSSSESQDIKQAKKDGSLTDSNDIDDENFSSGKKILIAIILLGIGVLLFVKFRK